MTEQADKKTDANIIESEAGSTNSGVEGASPSAQKPTETSSGGGFVWLLAILLVIGGGGYAVWPFVAPTVEPAIQKARATLGFQARPTQPSLPSAAPMDQPPITAPMVEQATPPIAQQAEPEALPALIMEAQPVPEPEAQVSVMADVEPPRMPSAPMAEPSVVEAPAVVVSPDLSPMVESLTDRLDVLEAQLLSATRSTDGERANVDATAHLTRTLSELRADMATLKTRVAALESAPRGVIDPSASAQALVLSVTQLATQVGSDRPYLTALDALERIGGAEPVIGAAVARLRPYAASGVPTQASVAVQFKSMAVNVMKAHGQTKRNGWWDEVVGQASSLVTVRQTDPARIEDPVERALAVAELALKDGDLKTALAAIDSLQGAEGAAAGAWREAARARVEMNDAMAILHNHALTALAATGGA